MIEARLETGERLCATCWDKHTAARKPCVECGNIERLRHHGLCPSCARLQIVSDLLSGDDGNIRSERSSTSRPTGPNVSSP